MNVTKLFTHHGVIYVDIDKLLDRDELIAALERQICMACKQPLGAINKQPDIDCACSDDRALLDRIKGD